MGCDIHMYVEYIPKELTSKSYWQSWGARINPGRWYRLFGVLAQGVRTDDPNGFPCRDVPNDMGIYSSSDYYVTNGSKIPVSKVPCCDWHSASWLTVDEFSKALEIAGSPAPEYHALLMAMRTLEFYAESVRVVFWFDN